MSDPGDENDNMFPSEEDKKRYNFMKEFYKEEDKRTGMDQLPLRVSGGRWGIYEAFGGGKNPYLSREQWDDLKDFSYDELLEMRRK